MSRPSPLKSAPSSSHFRPNDGQLTPRTPHSRAGRAEEAYTDIELDNVDDEQPGASQPLLASQGSGYRSHGDDYNSHNEAFIAQKSKFLLFLIMKRTPLILGSIFALLLLLLAIISYKSPDILHAYLGPNPTDSVQDSVISGDNDTSLILTYEKYNFTQFPLDSREYEQLCADLSHGFMKMSGFWKTPNMGIKDVLHHDDPEDPATKALPPSKRICSGSITYMLDHYVGLTSDLALIAQTAAFARERNKTFFIDDTRWDRGRWTDYFKDVSETQPGPEPGCLPPPPEELVACPRLARHWLVNARTARYHFGHGFEGNYQDAYAIHLNRYHPIYEMARESFNTTIVPSNTMRELIEQTRNLLGNFIAARHDTFHAPSTQDPPPDPETNPASQFGGTSYMAVHIRRGDRTGGDWPEYHHNGGFVPLDDYVSPLANKWRSLYLEAHPGSEDSVPDPIIYIASDSPEAMRSFEKLAPPNTTFSLDSSGNSDLEQIASVSPYVQSQFTHFKIKEKARLTQGMIVDFAMVSGFWAEGALQPDTVTCTISSSVCKLAAVGLGWHRAFGDMSKVGNVDLDHARWLEVQDKNRIYPQWQPLELFY